MVNINYSTLLIESLISSITDLERSSKTVLDALLKITESEIGFVGIIEPGTKVLVIKSFKNVGKHFMKEEKVIYPDENDRYPAPFGYAINERIAFYINDLKAYPVLKNILEDYFLVERFIVVPVMLNDKVLGLIVLANSKKDYTNNDLEQVKKIGKYYAIALERYWLEKEIKKYTQDLERIVEEKVKELHERETLAAIGQMTLMVAHDLRNPLQVISNYSFLLDNTAKSNPCKISERVRKYVQVIEKNILYIDRIAKDLQYLGKREAKLEPVNLQAIVGETLKQFPKSENIKIIKDVDNIRTQLDPLLIVKALSNIILNAIQAMPKGGTLMIKAKQKNSIIEFTVTDTGVGMSDEVKRNLFKPFYTTKSKGMGLGLALVKHVVDLHHGTIEVESEPNKGTKITIKIPSIK
ncbi:MAG: ATP-binding protein [Nitrososphaeria archaeon]|nr:ATP-binding protein [Nitrososphaeria archaeon]